MGGCTSAVDDKDKAGDLVERQPGDYIKLEGTIWDVFEFKDIVGMGASAQVARAIHKESGATKALKMMGEEYHKLFKKEVLMIERLKHKNIVAFFEAYQASGSWYIASEFCAGGALIQRIANRARYTEYDAARTFKSMLEALDYLHKKNIIHRDIKPENFVYAHKDIDAGIKLLDFGIAMDVDPQQGYNYRAGTPYYMAPEVIRNSKPRDGDQCKKADVWALGVCLFIILNGQAPFKGSSKQKLFDNILFQKKIKFKAKNLSKEAKSLCFKLLNRDVKKRITIAEALEDSWVSHEGKSKKEFERDVVTAMKLYTADSSVRRGLQKIAISQQNQNDIEMTKKFFEKYDINKNGRLNEEECILLLKKHLGYYEGVAKTIAKEMIKSADTNKDGTVDFNEFQGALARFSLGMDDYRIHAVFTALDENGDGFLGLDEFAHILSAAHPEHDLAHSNKDDSLAEVREIFKKADTSGDGKLSFKEFLKICKTDITSSTAWKDFMDSTQSDKRINDNDKHIHDHKKENEFAHDPDEHHDNHHLSEHPHEKVVQ